MPGLEVQQQRRRSRPHFTPDPSASSPLATTKRLFNAAAIANSTYVVTCLQFDCRVTFENSADQSCVFANLMKCPELCVHSLASGPYDFRPSMRSCPRLIDCNHSPTPPLPNPLNQSLATGLGSRIGVPVLVLAGMIVLLMRSRKSHRQAVSPL